MGYRSAHFARREFACPHCGVALVRDRLLICLEQLRAYRGRPIRIVSGYRCPPHNAAIGGAPDSQHMYAAACDIPAGTCTIEEAQRAGFTGIGTKNGIPVHLDVRDGPPARWTY
jgi:uncharacterized protein YcbK (DUF882 family)